MKLARRTVTFRPREKTKFGEDYLQYYMQRYHLNVNQTIEKIFEEHATLLEQQAHENLLGELLTDRLKKDIGLIRLRSGYTDKNTQIIIELLNTIIIKMGIPHAALTTKQESTPLLESKEKVEAMIRANMEKKASHPSKKVEENRPLND